MRHFAAIVVASLFAAVAHADNFRCGKWIATPDLSPSELVARCGQPSKREARTEDVYARGVNGGSYKTGEVTIETWIYERGSSASPMVVTIVDGKIERIERQQ
jgi:uncharacterized protein DUF2845